MSVYVPCTEKLLNVNKKNVHANFEIFNVENPGKTFCGNVFFGPPAVAGRVL